MTSTNLWLLAGVLWFVGLGLLVLAPSDTGQTTAVVVAGAAALLGTLGSFLYLKEHLT